MSDSTKVNLTVRVDRQLRARLDAYAEHVHATLGARITLAAAVRAAVERGLDGLEADIAKATQR